MIMVKKTEQIMRDISDEQLSCLCASKIDVDSALDEETRKRIFQRTASALGLNLEGAAKKSRSPAKMHRRWLKIASVVACLFVAFALTFTAVYASNEAVRESVWEILEYLHWHPEEKRQRQNEDPDYKQELKERFLEEVGATERVITTTEYPVAETVSFHDLDTSAFSDIVIRNMMTGETAELTDASAIAEVTGYVRRLRGSSPISNRGYSGGYYFITMHRKDSESIQLGFAANAKGEYVFTYGVFEKVNEISYPCRYLMSGVDAEEMLEAFSNFFGES